MNDTTLTVTAQDPQSLDISSVHSLYHTLQALVDPRRPQGKRYELALVLILIVLAKLAGQTTLSGATQWIRQQGKLLAQHFGLQHSRMPCQMTYCNVLAQVDAGPFGCDPLSVLSALGSPGSVWAGTEPVVDSARPMRSSAPGD